MQHGTERQRAAQSFWHSYLCSCRTESNIYIQCDSYGLGDSGRGTLQHPHLAPAHSSAQLSNLCSAFWKRRSQCNLLKCKEAELSFWLQHLLQHKEDQGEHTLKDPSISSGSPELCKVWGVTKNNTAPQKAAPAPRHLASRNVSN